MSQQTRLDRIDAAVACHRNAYLAALWAGHDGECELHEAEVDRLLGLRWRIQSGKKLAVT